MQHTLAAKIADRSALVGIVGLGYVGLPLMLRFAESGFRVLAFDIDPAKVDALNAGQTYIEHIPAERVTKARPCFEATLDLSRAGEADALILCVPTPLNSHREPDLSFILGTAEALLPHLRPGQVVSLESTTYPGTTEEHLLPRLESRGLTVGVDAFLVYSPEREDPGNPNFSTHTIPKVCGGHTAACLQIGLALYGSVIEQVVPVSSTRVAEMTKLLENIHRAVNIGLVNELKIVADRMGIDIHEVIRAAATKPFGFVPYHPGPGLGGHCIPIDPFYLTWKAREYGLHTRFIELAGEVNAAMPDYAVAKVSAALNRRKRAVNGSRVLVLGIAYKKNVGDTRESPSVCMMDKLRGLGAEVHYSDPHVPVFPKMREYRFDLRSEPICADSLGRYDCVLLATDHDRFDYDLIERHATLIVDCRGRYLHPADHIVKA
ncbi:nucleotide sugar dehydrogenase [Caldimonas brevitalea]|uniref:UDP-N-acetyl-D-glucosamine dehydrogenase n=1 Tax=Caldimonas brevitalea TaxID=413882 RepID=A0A0G3BZC7_9BURK|nr:nucleotide sugar dehydrogenase [Caldimonas brevitalea]AKJ31870.1 UDP-N-acetyl-D-glucosamine dehydrogenase [Caldimonas brevitalea]